MSQTMTARHADILEELGIGKVSSGAGLGQVAAESRLASLWSSKGPSEAPPDRPSSPGARLSMPGQPSASTRRNASAQSPVV